MGGTRDGDAVRGAAIADAAGAVNPRMLVLPSWVRSEGTWAVTG